MRKRRKFALGAALVGIVGLPLALAGCQSDSDTVSQNLSTQAEQFKIARDIVFYNGITDKYIAEVKGYCSVDTADGVPGGTLAVTCKSGKGYTKDYLGKSDNVTWFSLQADPTDVSAVHRTLILKPGSILPEFQGGANP